MPLPIYNYFIYIFIQIHIELLTLLHWHYDLIKDCTNLLILFHFYFHLRYFLFCSGNCVAFDLLFAFYDSIY